MIKQIGRPLLGRPILLITRMITDRSGLHSVLLTTLLTEYQATSGSFLKIKTEQIPFRTVQLLRDEPYSLSNCPIESEIRAVDSQSDVRILL